MASEGSRSSGHSPVVIIGAGIIGLSTAHYLSQERKSGRSITIVDNASSLFAGASGKANGILGDYDFAPEAGPLGKLSWELYRQLASLQRGRAAWGYRDVMIYHTHRAASSNVSKFELGLGYPPYPPSGLPTWCGKFEKHAHISTSNHEHAARINPADFCKFLQKSCEEMGVQILLDATVTGIGINQGSLVSVDIAHNRKRETVECHSLVIAAGPWSETVLSGLFPSSRVRIPSSKQSSSGNYIVAKVPGWIVDQDTKVCHQIYLEGFLGHKVDISSRPDGTLYIGGSLSAQEALPETATDVQPQTKYVRKMQKLVECAIGCSSDEVTILEVGRAYRPCLEHGRPIVAQVPLDHLLGMTHQGPIQGREVKRGGVYLNVGHGRDGIALGPGSGKVMSELIEGGPLMSADISGLGVL